MPWEIFSKISDVLGVLSCFASVTSCIMAHSIFKKMDYQRVDYEKERVKTQSALMALRQNIWEDNLRDMRIRSELRTALFTYRQNYFFILSPVCHYHLSQSISILKVGITDTNKESLCSHIDFLVARLNKREPQNNDRKQ